MKNIKEIPILSFSIYSALNAHYSKHEKVNKHCCSGNCEDTCSDTCGDRCNCDK